MYKVRPQGKGQRIAICTSMGRFSYSSKNSIYSSARVFMDFLVKLSGKQVSAVLPLFKTFYLQGPVLGSELWSPAQEHTCC